MAGFGDAFGGAFANVGKNVAKTAAKKAVSKPRKSAPRRVSNQAQSGVNNIARSVVRNAQPRRSSSSSNRSANRNVMRPAGGGGSAPRPPVGNTPSGTIAASVPPTPAPVSPEDFLAGDTAFRSQQNAYQKALADYATQMAGEQSKYNGEYSAQTKQLGLDRTEGITNLRDDYASRGLINSGVFGDALGDLNTKFDTSAADLERAKQAYMSDLTTGQTNFKTTQSTLLEKARQEALQRRLTSMGQ